MDLILLIKASILGIVEGATEFLPVSSTGHLIIAGDMLNFLSKEKRDVFEIVIQLGAILAICWIYHQRLRSLICNIKSDVNAQQFVAHLFIAFLPLAILGLMFHKKIKDLLFNPVSVSIALIIGGVIILLIERLSPKIQVEKVEQMTSMHALKIGFSQSLALIPGVSRSGATILGGMTIGLSRQVATEFSFFLAIPVMFAATAYDLLKNRDLLSIDDLSLFLVGFIMAFISALIAVKTFIRYVANHDFKIFAWYRIIFGIIILFYYSH